MAKKRKKLNKPLAILLGVTGLLLVLLVVAAMMTLGIFDRFFPPDPVKLAEDAERLLKDGQYRRAIDQYDKAAKWAKKEGKAEYLMAAAEARWARLRNDPSLGQAQRGTLFRGALEAYREAVRLKPDYVDAQRRIVSMEFTIARGRGSWLPYIESLDDLHQMVPDDAEVVFERGVAKARMARASPDYDQPAAADFQKAIDKDPTNERFRLTLAEFHRAQNRPAEAEEVYKAAIAAIPDSVLLRVGCAEFYQREKRNDEALALLNEAVQAKPDDVVGYLALAAYHQRQRALDTAIENLNKALELDPAGYRAVDRLARVHLTKSDPAQAEAVVIKGIADSEAAAKTVAAELGELEAEDPAKLSDDEKADHLRRQGTVVLNHLLCDMLLNRLKGGPEDAELRKRIDAAIAKMQAVSEDNPYVTKSLGRLALADGDYVRAEQLLRSAYERFDNAGRFDARTAQTLIGVYRRLKQLGEAERIIRRFLDRNPNNPRAMIALAGLQMDYRNFEQAHRDVVQALAYDGSAPAEERLKPEALEEALKLKAVLDTLTDRVDRLPPTVKSLTLYEAGVLMGRARQKWLEGQRDAAITLATDVARRQGRYPPAILQLVRWYEQAGRNQEALKIYQAAQQALKDEPALLDQLNLALEKDPAKRMAYQLAVAEKAPDPPGRALRKAMVYQAHGKKEEYLQQLKAAEKIDPESPSVIEQLFSVAIATPGAPGAEKYVDLAVSKDLDKVGGRVYKARLAMARDDVDGAIRLIDEALKLRPRYSQAHAFLGACYLNNGQLGPARQAFEAAQHLNPANVRALLGLVMVAEQEGRPGDRAHWVTLAYKFRPEHPQIREAYLQLRESREDPEAVIRHREQIQRTQPGNLSNLARLGPLYERVGQIQKAELVYRQLWQRTGNSAQALRLLTHLLHKTDRDAEARSMLSNFATRAKDQVGAYLLWADYLEQAGAREVARQRLAKAAKLASTPKEIVRAHLAAARFEARQTNWAEAAEHQRKVLEHVQDTLKPVVERVLIGFLIESKQLEEAQKRIDDALAKDDRDVDVLTLSGLAYYSQNDFAHAKQRLDHVLSLSAGHADALVYRAQVHLANGDKGLAVADLKEALRANASPAVTMRLVGIYESMGDFLGAYNALRSLLNDQPGYRPALQTAIRICQQHKKWRELDEILKIARKAYPREPGYLIPHIQRLQQIGRHDRAVEILKTMRKVLPQSAEISLRLAQALLEAQQYDEALTVAEKLREHHDFGASAVAICGRACQKKGDPDKAAGEFQAALKVADEGRQLGFVVLQIRRAYAPDTKKAISQLNQWVGLRPESWELPWLLADMHMADGDYPNARKRLRQALANTKTDAQRFRVLRQLGLMCQQAKQFEQSKAHYDAALKLSPNDMIALNNLAWMLAFDLNQVDEALKLAERAYQQGPYNAHALDTYGKILWLKGDLEQAERILRRSVNILPMPANRYHLGELYEKQQKKADAIREHRAAWLLVKDKPDDEFHQRTRQALAR
ncbi:MAG: tetratricopeptide repeat protein, partial [Planctomycetota bacterium]